MSAKKGEPPRRAGLVRQNAVYPLKPEKPQLSSATIWTWRIVFLMLLVHWLWDIGVLVLLGATFAGAPNTADQILSLVQPIELLLFFRSRINLWKLSNIVILVASTTLTLDLIAIPTTWFAFRRRREPLFNKLLIWRLLITGSVLGTDMALMNGAFSSIKPDPVLIATRHLYITHVYMSALVILMFFVVPQNSPAARASSPSMSQRLRNLTTSMSISPARLNGRSSTPPECRSNQYAGRIVDVVTYEEPPPPPPPLPTPPPVARPYAAPPPPMMAGKPAPKRTMYLPLGESPPGQGSFLPQPGPAQYNTAAPAQFPRPHPAMFPPPHRGYAPQQQQQQQQQQPMAPGPSPYAYNVPPHMSSGGRPYYTAPRPANVSEAPVYPMNRSPMRSQSARRHM